MDERIHEERLEIGDPFGEALLEQLAGENAIHMVERSDGFLDWADTGMYFGPAEPWLAERARGPVLDIGAGAGRVSLALQAAGIPVTALDISPGAVDTCRRRGVFETFHGTVFDLAATRPVPFGTFVMMGNNLALLGSREAAPDFLDALASMAAPGAQVIGETLDPYQTDKPMHLEYHEQNRARGRMGGQLRLRIRKRRLASPWFDYLFTNRAELEDVIGGTGW